MATSWNLSTNNSEMQLCALTTPDKLFSCTWQRNIFMLASFNVILWRIVSLVGCDLSTLAWLDNIDNGQYWVGNCALGNNQASDDLNNFGVRNSFSRTAAKNMSMNRLMYPSVFINWIELSTVVNFRSTKVWKFGESNLCQMCQDYLTLRLKRGK